ncbi:MAG: LysR family transcriptional regulator [Lachnospiraceae bacterium]|nr:LysR family transcriptional regulator [Lachnospiraceae bacterium]
MNFQNLEYFIAAATECNFTKAAEKLYITQQSLSGQIAGIEKELNVKLFYRSKPLRLTEAGEVFYSYATSLLRDYRKLRYEMDMISKSGPETLNIGFAFNGVLPVFKNILTDYRRKNASTQYQIIRMSGDELIKSLRDGSVDFAITHFPDNDPAFVCYPLFREETIIIGTYEMFQNTFGPSADAVIEEIRVKGDFSLLGRCPYIKNTKNGVVSRFANRFIAEHIPVPNLVAETDSFDTLLEFCKTGAAFSFFPRNITANYMHDDKLSPFVVFELGESAEFLVQYGYLRDGVKKASVEELVESVQRVVGSYTF